MNKFHKTQAPGNYFTAAFLSVYNDRSEKEESGGIPHTGEDSSIRTIRYP